MGVGNLTSGSSAFSKSSLNIWKFTVHVLLKPGLKNIEHYFASVWDEWNCAVVWAFFGIALLWNWNENWPFPILWPLLSFSNLLAHSLCLLCINSYLVPILILTSLKSSKVVLLKPESNRIILEYFPGSTVMRALLPLKGAQVDPCRGN